MLTRQSDTSRRFASLLFWLIGASLTTIFVSSSVLGQSGDKENPTLEIGKPIERELRGGQTHSYVVAIAAEQYFYVIVDQRGIDVVVRLFSPARKTMLKEVDSPNGTNGPEPLSFVATSTGVYLLEVSALDTAAPTGRYEIKIEKLEKATPEEKDRVTADDAFAEAEAARIEGTITSLPKAPPKYDEAISLYHKLGDIGREAIALVALGRVYDLIINRGGRERTN